MYEPGTSEINLEIDFQCECLSFSLDVQKFSDNIFYLYLGLVHPVALVYQRKD
jgi:hypothetical protein